MRAPPKILLTRPRGARAFHLTGCATNHRKSCPPSARPRRPITPDRARTLFQFSCPSVAPASPPSLSFAPRSIRRRKKLPLRRRPEPARCRPWHSRTGGSPISIWLPFETFHEVADERFLRLWSELLGKQCFRAIDREICGQRFQFQARGAFRGFDFSLCGGGNFLRIGQRCGAEALHFSGGFAFGEGAEFRDFLLEVREPGLRFAKLRVGGGLGVSGICDRRADGLRFLLKHRRKLFAKDPNDHAGDDGKVDPLEDFRGAFGGRVASFFRSVRANNGKEQHK